MTQVLYRKYRPKTFREIEEQEHVVRTLQGALVSGRVGHAYLFCGPRGTGKTTMARLLAKALNCQKFEIRSTKSETNSKFEIQNSKQIEPCNICHSCTEINEGRSLDLIEIDAASNRGIDEIRNLKDSARVAASSSIHKVFIIDEVHMLTPPAFNALLKILEEPPAHIIFILATTEPHKLPDTVLSRVQRFDFKKITTEKIQNRLAGIARKEKISVNDDALAMLASSALGSLRDAESAFNKVIAYAGHDSTALTTGGTDISSETVAEILGIVPFQVHEALINLILAQKPREAISQINNLHEAGVDLNNFLKQFVRHLRTRLVSLIGDSSHVVIATVPVGQITPEFLIKSINAFIKASSEIKLSPVPQLPIELAILELTK